MLVLKPTDKKQAYVKRHPARRALTNKLSWIKRSYGELAKLHFINNHVCEQCGEDRMACLAIHHVTKSVFKTLCHNCHADNHSGGWTFAEGIEGRTKPLAAIE